MVPRYCDFFAGSFAGSWVVEDEELPLGEELLAPPAAEPVLPLEAPEPLGCAAELELESLLLGLLALGEAELAPPEAEPDFVASLEPDPLIPEEELDEEPGALGLDEAPADGDEGELLGEDDVLELEEPGVDEVLLELSPRSHAARPKASATAAAKMESFMCPPWLGIQRNAANCAPGLTL